ncbi:MAG: LytTR family DNA-binding domain-containing protein [Pseudomonadota bacterium]
MMLQSYLKNRQIWETLIFLALLVLGLLSNTATEIIDYSRNPGGPSPVQAWILEGTSHLGFALAIPLVLWMDSKSPLRFQTLARSLPAHVVFSVVFSAVHVSLMYVGRKVLFPIYMGYPYRWNHVLGEFTYEYLKDFRTYLLILSLIYLYRFVLLRLQGEAGFLAANDSGEQNTAPNDRFLVKKLGKEFLVRTKDIEWIESAGNYVNLHVEKRVYPLRGTMVQIADRLSDQGFIRVHRSAIVNTDRIAELAVSDSGDGELRLTTDARVPVSRRYRQQVRTAMSGGELLN